MRSPGGLSERFEQMVLVPNTPGQKAAAAVACVEYGRDMEERRMFLQMIGLLPTQTPKRRQR